MVGDSVRFTRQDTVEETWRVLQPLLDNVEVVGLGPALRILQAVARMTRESVEGQALELWWRQRNVVALEETHYLEMVLKKTCWYTVIAPLRTRSTNVAAGSTTVRISSDSSSLP